VFRTTAEIDRAVAKLRKRIQDIETLRASGTSRRDAQVDNVEHAIIDTIREEFGEGSSQYERHRYFTIDDGPKYMMGFHEDQRAFEARGQAQFERCIPGAMKRLEGLIQHLEEKRADLAEPEAAPRMAFEGRSLNPSIASAAQSLFRDGHYANAVFEAAKMLVALVGRKAGRTDIVDASSLMQTVFSVNDPVLAFNDLSDPSDKSEQQGMMFLYAGAAMAVRNPLGHRVDTKESPERALQYLELVSFLADRLDETRRLK
jgi:uncharacterized protein (TIGR02391 family)